MRMRMYLGALASYGLKVVPSMIERVTVSPRFGVAGKFDVKVSIPSMST